MGQGTLGILGNEAADVLAKNAAEGVPLDDHEKWMSGGGGDKKVGEAEEVGKCGGRRGYKEGDGMAAEGSNKLLPTARRKGHRETTR